MSDAVTVFRALADPVRLEIVRRLVRRDEVACTTFESAFRLAKSTISYHVRILRDAGLIRVRRDGPYFHYRIVPEAFEEAAPGLLDVLRAQPGGGEPPVGGRRRAAVPPSRPRSKEIGTHA